MNGHHGDWNGSGGGGGHKHSVWELLFLAFEAVMHTYVVYYLLTHHSALLVIGFTVFELFMFMRLFIKTKKIRSNPSEVQCLNGKSTQV